ncbi:hypothetical protein Ciccas_004722 [Cichlidogyrus casuarinus]|uniref:Uncharacterized protein n=1 Tax=Cichlidogyrus casuarinus TaxID=1844966 RepID=A0ABD2QAP6_9PLAT
MRKCSLSGLVSKKSRSNSSTALNSAGEARALDSYSLQDSMPEPESRKTFLSNYHNSLKVRGQKAYRLGSALLNKKIDSSSLTRAHVRPSVRGMNQAPTNHKKQRALSTSGADLSSSRGGLLSAIKGSAKSSSKNGAPVARPSSVATSGYDTGIASSVDAPLLDLPCFSSHTIAAETSSVNGLIASPPRQKWYKNAPFSLSSRSNQRITSLLSTSVVSTKSNESQDPVKLLSYRDLSGGNTLLASTAKRKFSLKSLRSVALGHKSAILSPVAAVQRPSLGPEHDLLSYKRSPQSVQEQSLMPLGGEEEDSSTSEGAPSCPPSPSSEPFWSLSRPSGPEIHQNEIPVEEVGASTHSQLEEQVSQMMDDSSGDSTGKRSSSSERSVQKRFSTASEDSSSYLYSTDGSDFEQPSQRRKHRRKQNRLLPEKMWFSPQQLAEHVLQVGYSGIAQEYNNITRLHTEDSLHSYR